MLAGILSGRLFSVQDSGVARVYRWLTLGFASIEARTKALRAG
jgi:hypothetical protein